MEVVTAMEAVTASSALYTAYAWAVDDLDYEALRTLMVPDVVLRSAGFEAAGVDALIATYQRLIGEPLGPVRHLVTNVRAARDTDGRIRTSAYFQAHFHRGDTVRTQTGRYRDVHVETPSGLRIAEKVIEIDGTWTAPLEGGAR